MSGTWDNTDAKIIKIKTHAFFEIKLTTVQSHKLISGLKFTAHASIEANTWDDHPVNLER